MGRPAAIEWPDKAKICVTFIVPWEVWPENFGTHESLQRQGGAHDSTAESACLNKTWRSSPNENMATASASGESSRSLRSP